MKPTSLHAGHFLALNRVLSPLECSHRYFDHSQTKIRKVARLEGQSLEQPQFQLRDSQKQLAQDLALLEFPVLETRTLHIAFL